MKRLHVACVAAFLAAAPGTASAQWTSSSPPSPAPEAAPAAAPAPQPPTTAYAPPTYPYPAPYPAYAYGSAYAAPPPPLTFSPSELPPEDDGPVAPRTARRKRKGANASTAGMVLTLAGATAAATGGGVLGAAADAGGVGRRDSLGYREDGTRLGVVLGGTLLAVGGACLLVGIPLWAVGASRSPSSSR